MKIGGVVAYERDDFVVRRDVFGADDLDILMAAAEEFVGDLQVTARAVGRSHGGYTFQTDLEQVITVKWEDGKMSCSGSGRPRTCTPFSVPTRLTPGSPSR